MAENEKNILENIGEQEYKYGFTTDIETETIGKGLSEEVVRLISAKKGEPAGASDLGPPDDPPDRLSGHYLLRGSQAQKAARFDG